MTSKKPPHGHAEDGWSPQRDPRTIKEGYQPSQGQGPKPGTSKEQGGYQPTSKGDNPGNNPTPPGPE
jgi:hypothetical protein